MFVRSVKIRSSNGTLHEYVRIVTSVRDNGRVKQKVIANLGRRDTLEAVLPMLNRFLCGDDDPQRLAKQLAEEGPIEVLDASTLVGQIDASDHRIYVGQVIGAGSHRDEQPYVHLRKNGFSY